MGVQFAFGVEGYLDGELKEDPRYVKGIARIRGQRNGVKYEKLLKYHKCTDSDWDSFAPPAQ